MDYYVDIDLQSDQEFPAHQLMSALYAKLHRALAARQSTGIGVSFPKVDADARNLGTQLRLHGNRSALIALLESGWLAGMRDHVALTSPAPVPPTAQHGAVRRVQVKSGVERLMRRHHLDVEEARRRIPDTVARSVPLPFIQLHSTSTGQIYRLFIEHGPARQESVPGTFNTYGLS
jgi:CRISPR-associated endonuclease Csy4